MGKIRLVDGREIDTTNKTTIEVIVEALKDIPMTTDDICELGDTLKEIFSISYNKCKDKYKEMTFNELDELYSKKCNKFEETLSIEQQEQFYELENLHEILIRKDI